MDCRRHLAYCLLCIAFSLPVFAQESEQVACETLEAPLVAYDTKSGTPIEFSPNELRVSLSGRPAAIASLEHGVERPIVILLDASGSMDQSWVREVALARQYADSLQPNAPVALAFFRIDFRVLARGRSDVSNALEKLPAGIVRENKREDRRTALFNAIAWAVDGAPPRTDLVIFTDGVDNASKLPWREAEGSLLGHQDRLFAVALGAHESRTRFGWGDSGRTPEEAAGPHLLAELAEESGGTAFDVTAMGDTKTGP